jgi:hypothetical protein
MAPNAEEKLQISIKENFCFNYGAKYMAFKTAVCITPYKAQVDVNYV